MWPKRPLLGLSQLKDPREQIARRKGIVTASAANLRRAPMSKLRVTLVKSGIGYAEDQKRTLTALGFKRMNQSVVLEDSNAVSEA